MGTRIFVFGTAAGVAIVVVAYVAIRSEPDTGDETRDSDVGFAETSPPKPGGVAEYISLPQNARIRVTCRGEPIHRTRLASRRRINWQRDGMPNLATNPGRRPWRLPWVTIWQDSGTRTHSDRRQSNAGQPFVGSSPRSTPQFFRRRRMPTCRRRWAICSTNPWGANLSRWSRGYRSALSIQASSRCRPTCSASSQPAHRIHDHGWQRDRDHDRVSCPTHLRLPAALGHIGGSPRRRSKGPDRSSGCPISRSTNRDRTHHEYDVRRTESASVSGFVVGSGRRRFVESGRSSQGRHGAWSRQHGRPLRIGRDRLLVRAVSRQAQARDRSRNRNHADAARARSEAGRMAAGGAGV